MTFPAHGLWFVVIWLGVKCSPQNDSRLHAATKQLLSNYLTGLRDVLETALLRDKRPKPRSDIEAAMFVVNVHVRQQRRTRKYEREAAMARREGPASAAERDCVTCAVQIMAG